MIESPCRALDNTQFKDGKILFEQTQSSAMPCAKVLALQRRHCKGCASQEYTSHLRGHINVASFPLVDLCDLAETPLSSKRPYCPTDTTIIPTRSFEAASLTKATRRSMQSTPEQRVILKARMPSERYQALYGAVNRLDVHLSICTADGGHDATVPVVPEAFFVPLLTLAQTSRLHRKSCDYAAI
jgi:hypothetical protein